MRRVKIGEVFDLQMGKTPSRNKPEYWNNGDYDWVSIRDLGSFGKYVGKTAETISSLGVAESGIKTVPAHTLIMSFKLSLGKTAITTQPTYTNEAIMAFIDKGTYPINLDYLYHQFSGRDWSAGTNKAVMGATLNKRTLADMVITVPDGEEQAEVAAVLDGVELAIGLQQQRLDAFDQLVKSRFVEMFGGQNEDNSLPLIDCCISVSGGMTPSMKHEEYYGGDVPFIKSGDVKSNRVSSGSLWLTETALQKTTAKYIPRGSVIVVTRSGILKHTLPVAIAENPLVINQDLKAFMPKPEFRSQYLAWAIRSKEMDLLQRTRATSVDNIESKTLFSIPIKCASEKEQEEFEAFVAQVDKSRFAVQQAIEQLETLKASLMQGYFG